jgi:nitrogen regulatory protein PII
MKLILAILQPEKLTAVQTALDEWDVFLLTASEVRDCRKNRSTLEIYRGREVRRPVSKLRLEIAVEDSCFDDVVDAISRAGCSGHLDDSDVFVMGLDGDSRPCPCERDLAAQPCFSSSSNQNRRVTD